MMDSGCYIVCGVWLRASGGESLPFRMDSSADSPKSLVQVHSIHFEEGADPDREARAAASHHACERSHRCHAEEPLEMLH